MKIILAYSGGLDTSVLVHWYANSQNAEVITYCADVGQEEELDGLEEKALATGATAHRTLDLVDEFAKDFIYPMVRGNAIYESQYLLGTSIARPLIAKAQIEIAREFHTVLVANVEQMGAAKDDMARRFINMVDEFYDRAVKLVMTAETPIEDIYAGGRLDFEFERTRSRLQEMQSSEYLGREHRA